MNNTKEKLEVNKESCATASTQENIQHIIKILGNIKDSATIVVQGGYELQEFSLAQHVQQYMEQTKVASAIHINLWKDDYKDPLTMLISKVIAKRDNKASHKRDTLNLNNVENINNRDQIANYNNLTRITAIVDSLHNKDKHYTEHFKRKLKGLVMRISARKKMIFLIEELEVCSAEFITKTLETIKYFFAVNNIVFILFINNLASNHINNTASKNYIDEFINLPSTNYNFTAVINYSGLNILPNIAEVISSVFKLEQKDMFSIMHNIKLFVKLFPIANDTWHSYNEKTILLTVLCLMFTMKQKSYNGTTLTDIIDNKNYQALQNILSTIEKESDKQMQQYSIKIQEAYKWQIESFSKMIKILINILANKVIYSIDRDMIHVVSNDEANKYQDWFSYFVGMEYTTWLNNIKSK